MVRGNLEMRGTRKAEVQCQETKVKQDNSESEKIGKSNGIPGKDRHNKLRI